MVTEEIRQATLFGARPAVSFERAAAKYVLVHEHKKSLRNDITRLKNLVEWIGNIPLHKIHQETLKPWKEARVKVGRAPGTINHGIKLVNQILKLAANEWVNDFGLTWLERPLQIKLLADDDKRQPYPMSWDEQQALFACLPTHLVEMGLFAVNTGCRDQEICNLRWSWEVKVPQLDTSVFIVPGENTKNGDDRLVVMNRVVASVIESRRGQHSEFVFTYDGRPTKRMMNSAWLNARNKVGLSQVRVHDLKHTYGRRLRSAGVSFEDRQDLLGHRSSSVTTDYSAPELNNLIDLSNRVCEQDGRKPELVILRRSG